jgi:membrane protein
VNRVERLARRFDSWQQRNPPMAFAVAVMKKFGDDQAGNQVALLTYFAFVATFPLLLALTTILGVALRKNPELQRDLVNSAFAEFPIIGAQIHDQVGVATFGNAFTLTVGVLGALFGGRGFANALQDTFSSLWTVPKVDRPGFPTRYLRAAGLLLLLGLFVSDICGPAVWFHPR